MTVNPGSLRGSRKEHAKDLRHCGGDSIWEPIDGADGVSELLVVVQSEHGTPNRWADLRPMLGQTGFASPTAS